MSWFCDILQAQPLGGRTEVLIGENEVGIFSLCSQRLYQGYVIDVWSCLRGVRKTYFHCVAFQNR